jgi:hypothetical protein
MRPSVAILGFVFGSAAAITFALAGTAIVFTVLRADHPRLDVELAPLLINLVLFALLTASAGTCFYGAVRERPWRRAAVSLATVIGYQVLV